MTDQKRCQTCGSDDPKRDLVGDVLSLRPGDEAYGCCPDPFHSPVSDQKRCDGSGRIDNGIQRNFDSGLLEPHSYPCPGCPNCSPVSEDPVPSVQGEGARCETCGGNGWLPGTAWTGPHAAKLCPECHPPCPLCDGQPDTPWLRIQDGHKVKTHFSDEAVGGWHDIKTDRYEHYRCPHPCHEVEPAPPSPPADEETRCDFCEKPAAQAYAGRLVCAEPSACREQLGPPSVRSSSERKIALASLQERRREQATGMRAPEAWEGDPQPLEPAPPSPPADEETRCGGSPGEPLRDLYPIPGLVCSGCPDCVIEKRCAECVDVDAEYCDGCRLAVLSLEPAPPDTQTREGEEGAGQRWTIWLCDHELVDQGCPGGISDERTDLCSRARRIEVAEGAEVECLKVELEEARGKSDNLIESSANAEKALKRERDQARSEATTLRKGLEEIRDWARDRQRVHRGAGEAATGNAYGTASDKLTQLLEDKEER